MAKPRSAGDLAFKVAFEKRMEADRGDGVTVGEWQEQFQCAAGVINLRGGEAVMAGRLQGKSTRLFFIRSFAASKLVDTDWQVRDVRTGVAFNIREISASDDRAWLDLLCESGVATG